LESRFTSPDFIQSTTTSLVENASFLREALRARCPMEKSNRKSLFQLRNRLADGRP